MTKDNLFKDAQEALKEGKRARARDLLTQLLRADQKNPEYWLYMSAAVDSAKERKICLENVLRVDPRNETAIRGLVFLGERDPDAKSKPIKPERQRQWDIGEVLTPSGGPVLSVETSENIEIPVKQLYSMILVSLSAVGLLIFGASGNPFNPNRERAIANFRGNGVYSMGAAGPNSESGTPAPENFTPEPTQYSFNSSIQSTYTPTPAYINTPHPNVQSFSLGIQNLGEGDFEKAVEFFTQALETNKASPDIHYYLGIAYLEQDEYLKAKEAFERAINFDDRMGPAYLGRAQAELGLNPKRVVSDDINKAITYSPEFIDGYLFRATYRLLRDNPEGAFEDIGLALELNPSSALAYKLLAQIHIANEDYPAAQEAAQTANQLDVTLIENYLYLGLSLLENGYHTDALAPLQVYLQTYEDDAYAWYLEGRAHQAYNNHETALQSFEKALKLDKDLYVTNYYRGISYLALGDYDNALERLENATRFFPKWFEAHLNFGKALLESGDTTAAYFQINKSTSFAKTDEQRAMLYYYRGLALEQLERHTEALNDWEALLDLPETAVPNEWEIIAYNYIQGIVVTSTPDPN